MGDKRGGKRKGAGRKPKDPREVLKARHFTSNDPDWEKIQQAAAKKGMNTTEYIRWKLLTP